MKKGAEAPLPIRQVRLHRPFGADQRRQMQVDLHRQSWCSGTAECWCACTTKCGAPAPPRQGILRHPC